jgi:hypothetical protein
MAVAHRALQDRVGEAVDLEEHDPRHVGLLDPPLPSRHPPDPPHVDHVVVHPGEDADRNARGRGDERDGERLAVGRELDGAVVDRRRRPDHERVQEQDQDEVERERERQPQRCDDRGQGRVQHRHDRRGHESPAGRRDTHARDDERRDQERRGRGHPGARERERGDARRLWRPAQRNPVGGLGLARGP